MANFIKPCIGHVTSPFGMRLHPTEHVRKMHKGIDLAEKGNVPIQAAADGVVIRIGPLGTYGNVVMIVHKINGKTYETNYAHLKSNLKVMVGQQVKQGDVIAYMGNTGSSTAQHLHFEIHDGRWATGQPNAVDPLLYVCFPEVVEIQKQLNKVGYKLIVDGIDGPNTESAIKDFQKKHKLVIDGNAGPKTLAALVMEITALNKPLPKPIVTSATKPIDNKQYRLMTGTFKTKEEADKAASVLKKEYGWVVYVKEE
jgi:murein DD-endopeptidase MepM/ murein hydrolase activator NlpD